MGEGFYGLSVNIFLNDMKCRSGEVHVDILGHMTVIHVLITKMKFKGA